MAILLTDGAGHWFGLTITNQGALTTTVVSVPVPVPALTLLTDGLGNWFSLGATSLGAITTTAVAAPAIPPAVPLPFTSGGVNWFLTVTTFGSIVVTSGFAAPLVGVGFLIANDILTDVGYSLFENPVNTVVPVGGILSGTQVVAVWDDSMYVGAQILVGVRGANGEVVTITATVPGTSFTASFIYSHVAGEPIVGATFPVRQPTDPLFTQAEMIVYLSTAVNDFLTDVPLVYAINESVTVAPTQQNTALPSDCMVPMRIATGGYPLRETSQSNLDSYDYRWALQQAIQPQAYFRDKIPLQNFGIWPRQNNTVVCEVVYQQRQEETMGLADGFLLPDVFLPTIKFRTLSFAYSKDGDARNPGLAKYWATRYQFGCKVAKLILGIIEDSNPEMAQ